MLPPRAPPKIAESVILNTWALSMNVSSGKPESRRIIGAVLRFQEACFTIGLQFVIRARSRLPPDDGRIPVWILDAGTARSSLDHRRRPTSGRGRQLRLRRRAPARGGGPSGADARS